MTRFFYVLTLLAFAWCSEAIAQDLPSAQELLKRSLDHHDPEGNWYSSNHTVELLSKRPKGADRYTTIMLSHADGSFGMEMTRDGLDLKTFNKNSECKAMVDGSTSFTKEQEDKYRLHCEGIVRWRHYHGYMLGLPMKLNDPGTLLDPEARKDTFFGNEVYALKVTYEAAVGEDIWYFYLDPSTYALIGTRFYHDESKNDGEYLIFEGEVEHNSIRLPKVRKWYYNNNGEFLGEDEILRFE